MRSLLLSAALMASAAVAAKACSVVEVVETKPSSRNAKITVLLSGQPKAAVNIEVISGAKRPHSFVTNSEGTVLLSELPIGKSCITVTAENDLHSNLCLEVSGQNSEGTSSFDMSLSLFPSAPLPLSLKEQIAAAEREPAPEKLRHLNGKVFDLTSEVFPGVEVQVYGQGSYPQNQIAKTMTTEKGEFAVPLVPGFYTVVFHRAGFKTAFRVIEISMEGREGKLHETLQIATCT